MKRILPLLAAVLLVAGFTQRAAAQRYCIIDSKYILEKMQEYKDAQTKLDNLLLEKRPLSDLEGISRLSQVS